MHVSFFFSFLHLLLSVIFFFSLFLLLTTPIFLLHISFSRWVHKNLQHYIIFLCRKTFLAFIRFHSAARFSSSGTYFFSDNQILSTTLVHTLFNTNWIFHTALQSLPNICCSLTHVILIQRVLMFHSTRIFKMLLFPPILSSSYTWCLLKRNLL